MTAFVRLVRTDYYFNGSIVKTTRALHANTASRNCFDHMQLNHYGADVAEVHDERDGKLHAVFTYTRNGELVTAFKREIKEGM